MFISPAFAQGAVEATEQGGGFFIQILPLILIFFIFYFMVLRPQNKRIQEHRGMVNEMRRGDRIVTGGGLIGTVKKLVGDDEVLVELAKGVDVSVVKSTIMTLRSKSDSIVKTKTKTKAK